jgi:hypothetical protein
MAKPKPIQLTNALTYRERMFVRIFDGDKYEAGRKCGYDEKKVDKLFITRRIQDAISRKDTVVDPLSDAIDIARRKDERMMFWMRTMNPDDGMIVEMKDRLRASELSGKADGDFIERVQVDEHREIVIKWGGEDINGTGSCDPVYAQISPEDGTP